ncbi:MAG: recombinase RecB [Nitrososphaeria archaeon]|nr:recombinase RecB [Nitrososphaeria archaeon]NIQ33181.1 recombinase RecB [Nitrososphaeria archaeon]
MAGSKVRGQSSERIARTVLTRLGFEILETNKRVVIEGSEAFEVDIIAVSPDGEKYCVEVKSGLGSVSDMRQVYADSKVLDLKPMMVCKGLADDAAAVIARELGVKVVPLSEYYLLLEPEELEVILRNTVQEVLNEYGFYPLPTLESLKEEEFMVIKEIANASSFADAAKALDMSIDDLGHKIGELRAKRTFPRQQQSFEAMKRFSENLVNRYHLLHRLEIIEKCLKRIEEKLD